MERVAPDGQGVWEEAAAAAAMRPPGTRQGPFRGISGSVGAVLLVGMVFAMAARCSPARDDVPLMPALAEGDPGQKDEKGTRLPNQAWRHNTHLLSALRDESASSRMRTSFCPPPPPSSGHHGGAYPAVGDRGRTTQESADVLRPAGTGPAEMQAGSACRERCCKNRAGLEEFVPSREDPEGKKRSRTRTQSDSGREVRNALENVQSTSARGP